MRNTALVVLSLALASMSVAQQPSVPNQSTRQNGVAERGDHVMGFSHDATTHHFRLLKDGGEILVTANDPNDMASVDEPRSDADSLPAPEIGQIFSRTRCLLSWPATSFQNRTTYQLPSSWIQPF
jgi:hypothetical protein